MPRRSAADLAILNVSGAPPRLVPPPELTGTARTIFVSIASTVKVGHFQLTDAPLLTAYSRAIVSADEATAKLAAEGRTVPSVQGTPKRSPWCEIEAQATKAMIQLARALRLSPQARRPSDPTRPSKPEPPVSYYDRVRMEEASADDEGDEAVTN